jgi:hypothetical protein
MLDFLSGMTTMGFLVAGLFFFRFWVRTGDTIFAYFGVSFCLLAIGQILGTLVEFSGDGLPWVYLLRLAAFTLLIVGIVAKNFGQAARKADGE